MHLNQFDVKFKPWPAINAQALVDFIVERIAGEVTEQVKIEDGGWTTLPTDGLSRNKEYVRGIVLITPEGSLYLI